MSYISKALQKAQLEKQASTPLHGNILANPGTSKNSRRVSAKGIIVVLFTAVALSVAAWSFKAADKENISKVASNEKITPKQAVPSPSEVSRYYSEALQKQRNNDPDGAYILYNKVLALEPNHIYALNNLGVIFMVQKKEENALELFKKAILLKNDYADPYYNIACIHAKANRVDESLHYMKSAVSIKPEIIKWAMEDSDLSNIRHTQEFKKLTGK